MNDLTNITQFIEKSQDFDLRLLNPKPGLFPGFSPELIEISLREGIVSLRNAGEAANLDQHKKEME